MKKFLSMLNKAALMMVAAGMIFSCSDGGDEIDQTTVTPPGPDPEPEKTLTLEVNPTTIVANGKEMAIFKVTDKDGNDVTTRAKITCKNTSTALQSYVFTTEVDGEYEFYATYESTKSNSVKVTALPMDLYYTLTVSPSEIKADGIGVATFTVTDLDGKEPASKYEIYCVTTDQTLASNTFSTYNAKEYQFFAKIYDQEDKEEFSKSNTVTLTATYTEGAVNNPTPIRWSEMKATPYSTVGCEIEVTGVQHNNFQFVVRPGAEVVTFRLDVYPLCRLYNSLFVDLCNNSEYAETQEWAVIEEAIRSYVFDASGAGAYIMNGGQELEIDWMNSQYEQADVVPDADYLIVAVGCTDSEGFEQGEMTIAHLTTTSEELIGNPAVKIEVETGWKKALISHKAANDDCKFFYHFYSWEGDLQPYIMAYGRKMYRDFMRHTLGAPVDINDGENNWQLLTWGEEADPSVIWMASAIALDANWTPAEDFQSETFQLKAIPDNIVEGTGTMTVDEQHTSSSIVWYDYTIDANARSMFNKLYNKETIEENKDNESWCASIASDILLNGGWGHANPNFKYSEELESYTGDAYTGREYQVIESALQGNGGYSAGGEYQFACVYKDAANNGSKLSFSNAFKIKERVFGNPEACQSNGTAELTTVGRTSIKFATTYDFENTSCTYFCWFFGDPTTLSSDEIVSRIFSAGNEGGVTEMWPAERGGYDEFTLAGLDPDTEYTMLYVFEDWNGVMGEGRYTTCKTSAGEGGENPAVTLSYEMEDGGLMVHFEANEDTKYMKYAAGDNADFGKALELDYLGEPYLGDPQKDAQYYLDLWSMWVAGEAGISTFNTTANLGPIGKNDLTIIICVPFGKDDVRGTAAYLIYDHGVIKSLHDFYDYEGEPLSVKRATSAPKVGQPKRTRIPAMLERPVELKWENKIDKLPGGEMQVIDMRKIASHPKATM